MFYICISNLIKFRTQMKNIWDFYDSLSFEKRFFFRHYVKQIPGVPPRAFYDWKSRRYIPAKYKQQVEAIVRELFPEEADNIEIPTDWKTFKKYRKDLRGVDWEPSPASGRRKGNGETSPVSPVSGPNK